MPAAWIDRVRRPVLALVLAAASTGSTCGHDVLGPTIDCDGMKGFHFIELTTDSPGFLVDHRVDIGDSVQVQGLVHRVDQATEMFNPQVGWYCAETATTPLPGAVSLATDDTELVRLSPGGWIVGLRQGTAIVTASSATHAVSLDLYVLVYSP
jgi:hypothetical protein